MKNAHFLIKLATKSESCLSNKICGNVGKHKRLIKPQIKSQQWSVFSAFSILSLSVFVLFSASCAHRRLNDSQLNEVTASKVAGVIPIELIPTPAPPQAEKQSVMPVAPWRTWVRDTFGKVD